MNLNSNALAKETSPYLLQHADNPVHWQPWNETTLERARQLDRPILVSIGYSTCHWCHVMERESFEDPEVADFMNAFFVNIKVDREERPDIDDLYMRACQILTGTAGWPLHVFLTPDLRPYFAGTYFPPAPAHRRMSWQQALQYALYNFRENRRAVDQQADRVIGRLRGAETPAPEEISGEGSFSTRLFEQLRLTFDEEAGGFGRGQKFPNTMALEFLLHHYYHRGEEQALRHLRFSLNTMLRSGWYDQVGGGIARYATDRHWRVPHFEKMLYDNALFAHLLARTYQFTGRRKYRTAMEETLTFLERELERPGGGFFAALDADSDGKEGEYYTWTKREIGEVLGDEADLFCRYFGLEETGNWEGTNILYQPEERFALADELGMDREVFLERMQAACRRLLAARRMRTPPHRDEKVILAWNALLVSAYVQACTATGEASYREKAILLLRVLERQFTAKEDGQLFRVFAGGQVSQRANLRDYAFLIRAMLDVFTLVQERRYLQRAEALTDRLRAEFLEAEDVLFGFSSVDSQDLFYRQKDLQDEEMPSGNAMMVRNLEELGILLGRADYRRQAAGMLEQMRGRVSADPLAYAAWANAYLAEEAGTLELAILGAEAYHWLSELQSVYLPFRVIIVSEKTDEGSPLLAGRPASGSTRIYVCRDYACELPLASPEEFKARYLRSPE